MSKKSNRTNKPVVAAGTSKALSSGTATDATQEPPVPEVAADEATVEVAEKPEIPVTEVTQVAEKVVDPEPEPSPEPEVVADPVVEEAEVLVPIPTSGSTEFNLLRDAFTNALASVEKHLDGKNAVELKVRVSIRTNFLRCLRAFIERTPDAEMRKAITYILDTYNTSPQLTPQRALIDAVNPSTKKDNLPEWFRSVTTLFILAADPETRFTVTKEKFDLSQLHPRTPAVMKIRILEYFKV